MVEIPAERRMRVLKLYFAGLPYDDIAAKAGVAKGSVVNIIEELRNGSYPAFERVLDQVDQLRELVVDLRKSGLGLSEASLGLSLFRRLRDLKVEPQEIERWIKLCRNLSSPDYPADKFVQACLRIVGLEEETGLSYEELEAGGRRLRSEVERLRKQVESYREMRNRANSERKAAEDGLKRYLDEKRTTLERINYVLAVEKKLAARNISLDKVDQLADWIEKYEALGYDSPKIAELSDLNGELKRVGVSREKVNGFVKDHFALKELGFSTSQAEVLAWEMKKMKLEPKEAVEKLAHYALQFDGLEQAAVKVQREVKEKERELESLCKQISLKREESTRLDETIKTKKDQSTSLGERCAELKEEIKRHENERKMVIRETADLLGTKKEGEEILKAIARLKGQKAEVEKETKELKQKLKSVSEQHAELKDGLDAYRALRAFLASDAVSVYDLERISCGLREIIEMKIKGDDKLLPRIYRLEEYSVRKKIVERCVEMINADVIPRWLSDSRVKNFEERNRELDEKVKTMVPKGDYQRLEERCRELEKQNRGLQAGLWSQLLRKPAEVFKEIEEIERESPEREVPQPQFYALRYLFLKQEEASRANPNLSNLQPLRHEESGKKSHRNK